MMDTKLIQGLLLTACLCLIVAIIFAVVDISRYEGPLEPLPTAGAAPSAPEQPAQPVPETPVQAAEPAPESPTQTAQ
ncbi:MAG: hypothetical protein R6X33_17020 [Candidatus Brocadiia bacterium]